MSATTARKLVGYSDISETVLNERSIARLVASPIVQGDITKGETLKVYVHDLAEVKDYVPGTGVALTNDTSNYVTLNNLKEKAVNEILDGLTAAMAPADLVTGRYEAAVAALAEELDKDFFTKAVEDGQKASTVAITSANVHDEILKLKLALDKAKAPRHNRYLVVSPEVENAILSLDSKVVLNTAIGENILYDGVIGKIAGFIVLSTTLIPEGVQMIAIQERGFALAQGWKREVLVENLNTENHIGDSRIGGRWAYNTGAIRPELIQISAVTGK